MQESNRQRKNEINYKVSLNEEQKEAKRLIIDNQITIITGRAGSGKSLVAAQTALDFIFKKMVDKIFVTRAMVEVESETMGFLPGSEKEKFNPYIEALHENLLKCYDKLKIDDLVKNEKIQGVTVNFIRGKTMDDILIIEEAQNFTKGQMLALLTRLGKTGKIIINGDNDQQDLRIKDGSMNGLQYATELSKHIEGIARINLKANHRSDLVGSILDYEYNKNKHVNN